MAPRSPASGPRGGAGNGHVRALGIVGTASDTGRTRTLIEAVLGGAADASAGAEVVVLGDYSIAVAGGTPAEEQTADTQLVLDEIERAHVVELGTPI